MKDGNIVYYDNNAEEFISGSVDADLSATYTPFLSRIPEGGYILDAGCGSGRDSLYFIEQGYEVAAFDGSAAMVRHCSELTGLKAVHATFDNYESEIQFDGIWACSSLLHVSREDLGRTLQRLSGFLKGDGSFYTSFKMRDCDYESDGRSFTCFTEEGFREFIRNVEVLKLKDIWTSADARPEREHELWLNVLMEKV